MSPKPQPKEHGHPDSIPTPQGRGQLVAGLVALGYRGQDLAAIIAPGHTRRQIAGDLIAMQRQAPKA